MCRNLIIRYFLVLSQNYIEMYGLGPSMVASVAEMFQEEDWHAIETFDVNDYCPMCMVRKARKSRHCPHVSPSN